MPFDGTNFKTMHILLVKSRALYHVKEVFCLALTLIYGSIYTVSPHLTPPLGHTQQCSLSHTDQQWSGITETLQQLSALVLDDTVHAHLENARPIFTCCFIQQRTITRRKEKDHSCIAKIRVSGYFYRLFIDVVVSHMDCGEKMHLYLFKDWQESVSDLL